MATFGRPRSRSSDNLYEASQSEVGAALHFEQSRKAWPHTTSIFSPRPVSSSLTPASSAPAFASGPTRQGASTFSVERNLDRVPRSPKDRRFGEPIAAGAPISKNILRKPPSKEDRRSSLFSSSYPYTNINPPTGADTSTSYHFRAAYQSTLDAHTFVAEMQNLAEEADLSDVTHNFDDLNYDIERLCSNLRRHADTVEQWPLPKKNDPDWKAGFKSAQDFVFYGALAVVSSYIYDHFLEPFHPILDPERNRQNIEMYNDLSTTGNSHFQELELFKAFPILI